MAEAKETRIVVHPPPGSVLDVGEGGPRRVLPDGRREWVSRRRRRGQSGGSVDGGSEQARAPTAAGPRAAVATSSL